MYFSLCILDNIFSKAEFAVTLLSGSAYTWYTTQYYVIAAGHANRLAWQRFKSNLQSYSKTTEYAYQTPLALLHCKQYRNIASYI